MNTITKNRRFALTRPICPQCVKLPEEIKRLREEKHRLEAQLRYQQRQITDHVCPECQLPLEHFDIRDRSVTEVEPVEVKKVVYKLTHRRCPSCRRIFWAKAPAVLPRFKSREKSVLARKGTLVRKPARF